jgi:hypothetical protein
MEIQNLYIVRLKDLARTLESEASDARARGDMTDNLSSVISHLLGYIDALPTPPND